MPSTDGPSGDQPPTGRPRASLAARISLVTGAVALVAVLLAGAVALPLIRGAAEAQARQQLAASADLVTAPLVRTGRPPIVLGRQRPLLARQDVDVRLVGPEEDRLPESVREAVADGERLSETVTVEGERSLVEVRPIGDGFGVVLVQPVSELGAPAREAVRRLLLALAVGLAGAAAAGTALAWRLARPLRRAAGAAQALAAGDREVRVGPDGPAEVAEVADAINRLAEALGHSEGRQREFLLSISHELRTPLTAVRGYAEALADGVVPPDRAAATGRTMLAEAHRLDRLVSDLMDLARLRADAFPVDLAEVDLGALIADAGQVWADRCAGAGLHLRLDGVPDRAVGAGTATAVPGDTDTGPVSTARSDEPSDSPAVSQWIVSADPVRVRQVLDGLAENALRVTPAGGVLVLALRAEPGVAVLEVRDSGPGLSEEDIAVAFERSALHDRYRGQRRVGAGVGLALIEELVRRMGGTAAAGHAPEGGAAFTVRLPLA